MQLRVNLLILAAAAFSTVAFAQPVNQGVVSGCFILPGAQNGTATGTYCQSAFQVRYFANLTVGDSFIDAVNDGSVITAAAVSTAGTTVNYSTGNICVNVYTFDPAEELVSCCACLVTPNGLVSLSADSDLISNTLTPASPTSITVKLLATTPIIQGSNPLTATQSCNASFPFGANVGIPQPAPSVAGPNSGAQNLAPALHAWGTTLHKQLGGTFGATETAFSNAALGITSVGAPATVKTLDEFDHVSQLCGFIQGNGSGFGICKSCRAGGLGAVKQ